MTFRPYPGFTIATVILFAILCGLGFWQLERLHWKLGLIAQVEANMTAAPLSLDAALKLPREDAQYHRVVLRGVFDHAHESYAFATTGGAAVYHVLTPFRLTDGRVLMVDRGAIPKEKLSPKSRAAGNVEGPTQVTGVWRTPDAASGFTPPPDLKNRIWYARDVAAMAAAAGVRLAAPVVVEADSTPNPGGWPRGGGTVISFRNQHLGYAVTWFALAASLLCIWLAFHISKGRIALK
ncbi:MAG: SURF1 family protein [Pseudomonadota bacterium]